MKKTFLLTATAAAVMAFAGAASASTLTFRTTATPSDIDAGDVGGPTGSYRLATEAANITPTSAVFALVTSLSAGSTFPSGNNFIIIDVSGGTFGSNVTTAQVQAPGCTSVLSSGGQAGSTTATFLISSTGGACNLVNLDLPIRPNTGSDVSVTSTLTTEAGSPIDPPNVATRRIVQRVNAFQGVVDGMIGSTAAGGGALNDTYATLTVNPVYTTFFVGAGGHNGASETTTQGQLGTISIAVDTTAYRTLNKTFVLTTDVTDADVLVTGSFSAFDGGGSAVTLGGVQATLNAASTTAAINNQQVALTSGPQAFRVTRETAPTPIPTSNYVANLTYTLNPAFYIDDQPFTGNLETIQRDGTNVLFPWMNSNSIQAVNGTTNIIRLGNVNSQASGPVFAQLLTTIGGGNAAVAQPPVQIFPSIAANGERVINTATLTGALGDFGRGDVLISIEAPPSTITARRYATLANGSVTELESGSVANDQNQTNVP